MRNGKMSKKTVFGIICLSLMLTFGACGLNTSAPKEQNISSEKLTEAEISMATDTESANESIAPESDTEPGRENAEPESPAGSDPSKDELGWDGEWVGDGVSVIISDSDSGFPNVEFNDEAHNATLDEASIEGNTLTGVYRITWEMYADTDDAENLPEQEWTIVMVKDGGTASYHRETVLTWFNLNDDGTYGHTVTKENSASLQKVYKTEN